MKPLMKSNKNFKKLMFGKAVSNLGSNMQQFALSLYVLSITGSATIFASIIAISIIPRLLLSPVAGVFGDWFDRKKSIVRLDLLNAVLIGIFALIFISNGELKLGEIYALVILLEITEIFFGSSMAAVVPSIVEKDQLLEANSIRSMVSSLSGMLSPVLAAGLFALIGFQILMVINAISFLLSALSEMTIEIPKTHKKPEKIHLKAFKEDLVEGIKIIKNNKIIKDLIGIGMILNFALSPLFSVGLAFIIRKTMTGTELQYGLYATLLPVAMMISPLLGKYAKKIPVGKLLVSSFFITSMLVIVLGLVTSSRFAALFQTNLIPYISLLAITVLIGMVVTMTNIAVGTLFDTLVPKEFMGRTGTMMNLGLTIAMPIGQIAFGLGMDIFQPAIVVLITGCIMLLAVLYYRKALLSSDQNTEVRNEVSVQTQ